MPAKVILNPYAGRWMALQRRGEAESALREAGVDFELVVTDGPGHGVQLAAEAVRQGFSLIISAGGDGSISEVVNGMEIAGRELGQARLATLGVLPLGTANDLMVNLKLPLELPAAAQLIAAGRTRDMDLGEVSHDGGGQRRVFDNNSAIGLEPTITLIQQEMKRLRGVARYLAATLVGIARGPRWNVALEWEGGGYSGPITLVTVGNNPLTGGLFYMTPHADPFDGLLTFVYGYMPTRLKTLGMLPKTMKPGEGSYIEAPEIHEVHSPWLRIRVEAPTPLHADGEIQSEHAREISYRVLPARLPILM
jgi:YegS/Rv2252/BmrU family lipid kinase